MPLYQRPGSPFYYYEFQYRGYRFRGSTGTSNRREAERFEKAKVEVARREIDEEQTNGKKLKPLTLDHVCDLYFEEKGKHLPRADQIEWALGWLVEHFGQHKLITDIDNHDISQMVAKRRGEDRRNHMQDQAEKAGRPVKKRRLVSAATVNRTTVDRLRTVMLWARRTLKQPIQEIDWKEYKLSEKNEHIREASHDEEAALFAVLPQHYHAIVRFSIRTGCRVSECVGLEWDAVDWGNRQIMIHGKGDKKLPIPLTKDMRDLLWSLRGQHATHVFCYPEKRRFLKDGTVKVTPAKPMTYSGVDSAWDRAKAKAGVKNLRYHDLRHTAATRLLRDTRDMKMVQMLMRHNQMSTTSRYAHVLIDELRDAMDAQVEPMQGVPTKTTTLDTELQKKAVK